MLKLRSIGIQDYSVFENKQRIGRIRFARERTPSGLAANRHRGGEDGSAATLETRAMGS